MACGLLENQRQDRVKEALNAQPQLKDLGLQVSESGGNVTVSGMVPNDRYGQLVNVVAEGINGVKSVDTSGLIAQEPQTGAGVSSPDTSAQDTPNQDIPNQNTTVNAAPAPAAMPEIKPVGSAAPTAPAPTTSAQADDAIAQAVESSKIAKAVYHAIRSNGELADDPIDVLQSGKSVILRGAVDNDHEQRLAEQIARGVEGVAGVDISNLKVVAQAKEMHQSRGREDRGTLPTPSSRATPSAPLPSSISATPCATRTSLISTTSLTPIIFRLGRC